MWPCSAPGSPLFSLKQCWSSQSTWGGRYQALRGVGSVKSHQHSCCFGAPLYLSSPGCRLRKGQHSCCGPPLHMQGKGTYAGSCERGPSPGRPGAVFRSLSSFRGGGYGSGFSGRDHGLRCEARR
ncbi:hypothetical protein PoB_002746700 [Plakobranchus ocellatus]|uniref:Uncharacterized protein n=1 Tax=Plakobranchus ocellatus TaxID=259542 RepID=A0AAV4A247_9GAST|nr:hypothetical protein PoB_002746700 [Plakobranchus ocellatus]